MSDDQSQSSTDPYDPDLDPDTDATMTAPSEGRPDHRDESEGADGASGSEEPAAQQPQDSDAEMLEAQEEEGPSDE